MVPRRKARREIGARLFDGEDDVGRAVRPFVRGVGVGVGVGGGVGIGGEG